jgi:hypothetical protein
MKTHEIAAKNKGIEFPPTPPIEGLDDAPPVPGGGGGTPPPVPNGPPTLPGGPPVIPFPQ